MKARALSAFRAKLRLTDKRAMLLNAGDIFDGDDDLVSCLVRSRMAEIVTPSRQKPRAQRKDRK